MIDLQIQLPPPFAAATGAAVGAVEGGTANRLFRGAADFLLGRFGHSYFHSLVAQVRSDTIVGKSQSCMVSELRAVPVQSSRACELSPSVAGGSGPTAVVHARDVRRASGAGGGRSGNARI